MLFYGAWEADPNITFPATYAVGRYDFKKRKAEDVLPGLTRFDLSADGKKMHYGTADNSWGIVDATGTPKPGDGKLNLSELQMKVDPLAEARQIFREAWRYQRDFFYVKNVHGLDMDWAWKTYSPWVESVRHRSDLNYILDIFAKRYLPLATS